LAFDLRDVPIERLAELLVVDDDRGEPRRRLVGQFDAEPTRFVVERLRLAWISSESYASFITSKAFLYARCSSVK